MNFFSSNTELAMEMYKLTLIIDFHLISHLFCHYAAGDVIKAMELC